MHKILSIAFCILMLNVTHAQVATYCPNLDFETGTLSNWSGMTGTCCPISMFTNGLVTGRHTIMSGPGYDPHSLNDIPVVAPGGGFYSLRLGNDNVNNEAEMIQYTVSVTTQSDLFIYRYAVVLEDPSHSPAEQPRFEIRTYDQQGNNILCGMYNVVSGANIPGFLSNGDVRYKKWTTVGIDLSPYLGQNVTIEFRTGDCALGGHYGYAYIDCSCGPLQIQNAFCPNSANDTLKAPEGFQSYLWSNGATTPTIVVPAVNAGQVYSVTLTAVTGCTLTLTTSIASTSINAAFHIDNNCQNEATFTDSTTAFNGTPNHWLWDFGDNTQATTQNATHTYTSPGTFAVQLISYSDMGCADTVVNNIQVWPSPQIVARVDIICEGRPTEFIDSVTIPFGNITSYDWTFSDSTSANISSPTHQFAAAGNYSAQLIATSDLGCQDTATLNFTVYPVPTIEAGPDVSFCGGSTVVLGDAANPAMSYLWSPGTGIMDVHSQMTFVNIPAPSQGSDHYTYMLTGVDTVSGCATKDSVTIEARGIPEASFTSPAPQCFRGNSFDLNANPTISGTTFQWFFGPSAQPPVLMGATASGIQFNQPGIYPLLLVADNTGCIDSAVGSLRVVQEPAITLAVQEQGCPPLKVDFQSFVTPAGPLTYSWSFTDGATSTDSMPEHLFTIPGDYGVSLSVTDPDGCKDDIQLSNVIHVLEKPEANFVTEPNVASIFDPHFTFTNLSHDGYMLTWDFGDNTYSTDSNTNHTYADTGVYFVNLIMQNSFGCFDTVMSPLRVEPYFNFYVPDAFTPNGDGVNDSFRGLGVYIRNYEMWIYNRWGDMIYFTSDYNKPWDGKGQNSTVAQNEVYEYLIKVKDSKDQDHQYIGHVTLVR